METEIQRANNIKRRSFVVLVPYTFQGHMTPMLQLGEILNSRGFNIIVTHTQYNPPEPSRNPEFTFHGLWDGLTEGYDMSFDKILGAIYEMNENCRAPLQNYLQQWVENQKICGGGDEIKCVIYDPIWFYVDSVADEFKIPSIVLGTFSASYLHAVVSILPRIDTIFPLQDSKLEDPLPDLDPLRFKDIPFQPTLNNDVPEPARYFCRLAYDIRSSVAYICNSVNCLENSPLLKLQQHYKVPLFPIGPFHKLSASNSAPSPLEDDDDCMKWLDKQAPKSVIYVSLGTIATMSEAELVETAWGLINSALPFLWVVRAGLVVGSTRAEKLLPRDLDGLPGDRARVVRWAPQKGVLEHPSVGGFLTHCGWNSTLESISAGVPMICRPVFADQPVIARYVTHVWKVGLGLEVLERGVVERTIKRLMVGDEGKELRKRAIDLKQNVEVSLAKNGTSCKALDELVDFISSFSYENLSSPYNNNGSIEQIPCQEQECST